jgi:pimeloyl-ACP methyl ester carboxylesterase
MPTRNWLSNVFYSFASLFSSSSKSVGKLILPAQWRAPESISANDFQDIQKRYSLNMEGGFVGTHDQAILDTIQLTPRSESNKPVAEQFFIVKFNGNGGMYQDLLRQFAYDANQIKATVIGFNFRGVGYSKKAPNVFQDLVTDGIAQVQRLLDDGANPQHITLDGHSLGGGVATLVAHHFHKMNMPVYIWNDRSFSSLSYAAAGIIAPEVSGILGRVLLESLHASSASTLSSTQWEVDVANAYKAIPTQYKGYMVVAKKTSPENQNYYSSGDGVIVHQGSLHKAVRAAEKKEGVTTGYKVLAARGFMGHNLGRSLLRSKTNYQENGQVIFENFARRNRG